MSKRMTAQDYKSNGYKVSMQIEQSVIDKAERTAMDAYVLPILPSATTADDDVKRAVMAIAFVLMTQSNVAVTRSGAKVKTTSESQSAYTEQSQRENAEEVARLINVLRKKEGAVKDAKVVDVAKLFFTTNFFYI